MQVLASKAEGALYVIAWRYVQNIRPTPRKVTRIPNSVEVTATNGSSVVFGGLLQRERVIRQMHDLCKQDRDEWASGLASWQPRRICLQAPLKLRSLLPCVVHVVLQVMDDDLTPASSSRKTKAKSNRQSYRYLVPSAEEHLTLQPGNAYDLYTLQVHTPLRLHIWMGMPLGETDTDGHNGLGVNALSGYVLIKRPSGIFHSATLFIF